MEERENKKKAAYRNRFVDLKELVYAPLRAVAESNMLLSGQLVDLIASTGTVDEKDPEQAIRLNSIKLAYEQIRADGADLKAIDEIALKVPLLSIIPLSNLQVSKTKVAFDAEVKSVHKDKKTGQYMLESRICSKKERRSDHIPKVSMEIEASSVPPPEGLARFIDILNANPIPETLMTKHLDEEGVLPEADRQEYYQQKRRLKERIAKLKKASSWLNALIERKKLEFGDILQRDPAQSGNVYASVCYFLTEAENREVVRALAEKQPALAELPAVYDQIAKQQARLEDFQQRIAKTEDKMLTLEVEHIDEQ